MLKLKNLSLFFSVLFCLSFFVSCDDDLEDGPLPSSALTTYTGTLTYTSASGDIITNLDGTATITLVSNEYHIDFSDNVPSVIGLTFVESNDAFAATSSSSQTGITINGNELNIGSTKNGNSWAFSGAK